MNEISIHSFAQSAFVDSLLEVENLTLEQTLTVYQKAQELQRIDLTAGLRYATKAATEAQLLDLKELIAESRLLLGRYYLDLGLYHGAITQTDKALEIYNELNNELGRAHAIKQIGDIYFYTHEYARAEKYFKEAFDFALNKQDSSLMINSLIMQGAVFGNINKMDSATMYFEKAAEWCKETGDYETEVLCYFNIADVLLYSGHPGEALSRFAEIERTYDFDYFGYRSRVSLYNSMTNALIRLGRYDEADYYNQLAYSQTMKSKRYGGLMSYYQYRFRLDTIHQDYRQAIQSYIKYKQFTDSVSDERFRSQMANFETLFLFEQKESQIEQLTQENALKELEIRQRNIVIYGAFILLILSVVIVIQFLISSKRRKEQLAILREQKQDLEAASEEIQSQSRELQNKNVELEELLTELQNTQEQMIQSEKMASLGILTAGVAHELNNPLNFISGGTVILKDILKDMEEQIADTGIIHRLKEASEIVSMGSERAASIVKALNTFSRQSKEEKSECCIIELVNNLLLFLKAKIGTEIRVKKNLEKIDKAMVYPDKMHQIFLNILDNAIDAMQSPTHTGEKILKISNRQYNDLLEFSVENSGPPIEDVVMNHLFDPFYTTKAPGKGTGLGLAIVYNLVKEHNGSIIVENTDTGVKFVVTIPMEKASS
ncbi:ATP-binding protein [Bacteroidota bacterium]